MKLHNLSFILLATIIGVAESTTGRTKLPDRYFQLMEAEARLIESHLATEPSADLQALEGRPWWRHFPACALIAAVLYAKEDAANPRFRDPKMRALALRIGDLLAAERLTYGTQFGMRIPAILYLPASRRGKIPALIVVNGHGGDKYSWYSFYSGILYARAGAAVLTYDPVGEGERNAERKSGTRAHDRIEPPRELARRLAGLMITDLSQAVSYLSQRPEIDSSRIGAMGYSLGSFVVGLTGAIERRLRACVLVGGGNLDGPNAYWDNTKPMCTGTPYRSLASLGDRPAVIYALHASRGPTLVFNGLEDVTVQIPRHREPHFRALQRRVAELKGGSDGVFETGFVPGVGHRPFFVTRPVGAWLERQLDLPNWNEDSITRMEETHIAEWAHSHEVALDPLYSSEHREGGTRALGTGVPALSRSDLSVFSPEEWARQKRRLIYQAWLEAAKARVQR